MMTNTTTSQFTLRVLPMGMERTTKADNRATPPPAFDPKPTRSKGATSTSTSPEAVYRLRKGLLSCLPQLSPMLPGAGSALATYTQTMDAEATALPELIARTFSRPARIITSAPEIRRKSGEALSGGSFRPEMGTPFEKAL